MKKNKTVIVTGSQGFIGSYLCNELLLNGYEVVGIDNYSKYGRIRRTHDNHEGFRLIEIDCSKDSFKERFINGSEKDLHMDYIVAGAAMIGGISYFHKYAYDLLATNERIIANTFDVALDRYKKNQLKRIIVLSSSMVYENSNVWPTPEGHQLQCAPPFSTYGFQKLSCEYFAKGAFEQHKLPYTIIRPFNCIGVGEDKALSDEKILSGNVKLMMSHVVPDIINKCLLGQDPLHILGDGNQIRHYTNGRDIATGIRIVIESNAAINQDFNISSSVSTTVLDLAEIIWKKINPDKPFRWISDPPFEYDVQKRIPDTSKANKILKFEAKIELSDSLDEVIEWIKQNRSRLNE
jgi:nucleoside-diphosphate-sugar epimerase